MQPGWRGLRGGRPAALLRSLRLGGEVDRGQLEALELGRALRPGNDEPPLERRDALEDSGHVAVGIVAIGQRLVLVAECKAAKEDQPRRVIVFPESAGRALASGLLDDRQLVALDLDIT